MLARLKGKDCAGVSTLYRWSSACPLIYIERASPPDDGSRSSGSEDPPSPLTCPRHLTTAFTWDVGLAVGNPNIHPAPAHHPSISISISMSPSMSCPALPNRLSCIPSSPVPTEAEGRKGQAGRSNTVHMQPHPQHQHQHQHQRTLSSPVQSNPSPPVQLQRRQRSRSLDWLGSAFRIRETKSLPAQHKPCPRAEQSRAEQSRTEQNRSFALTTCPVRPALHFHPLISAGVA